MVYQSQFIEMFGNPLTNSQNRQLKPFIEVVTLHRGYDLPDSKRNQSGIIPIYGANGLVGYHDVSMAKDGVVTGRSGAIGEVYAVEGDYWPLNTALFSIDTHGNNVIYLQYLLKYFDIKRFGTGTGVPTLNRNDVHKEQIYDVPVPDQLKFTSLVKQADKSKFDGYKSQFIEMFGDIIQDKDQFLKLQELIDKKWITYHLDGNHGGDYPRGEEFVDSGVPYISANCIDGHLIDWSKAKYLTEERAHLLKKGLSINEDVLFAHNATVGPVAILRTKENLVILGTSLTAYRCNKEYILPEYLLAYMDSSIFRSQYEAGMQQSTRNQVPITTQRSYLFLVPPIPAQKKYSALFLQADKSKYLN